MGGCKCTYRNCVVKSDGQTHMFHYPVFDKVRCHQWLKNAQRLDFLNLKVSQLKNRVVCQNHFKQNSFMNYKMDKLKYNAIPTENGPFCVEESPEIPSSFDGEPCFEIAPEDIEVDPLTAKDKKANFSVKYGDFLVNSEGVSNAQDQSSFQIFTHNKVSLPTEENKNLVQPMLVVPPYSNQALVQTASNVKQFQIAPDQTNFRSSFTVQQNEKNNELVPIKRNPNSNNKIKIISERKICAPVKVQGKLEPVSPSALVKSARGFQHTNKIDNSNTNIENMEVVIYDPSYNGLIEVPVEYVDPNAASQVIKPEPSSNQCNQSNEISLKASNEAPSSHIMNNNKENLDISLTTSNALINNKTESNSEPLPVENLTNKSNQTPNGSSIKSKIPPERVAAIEEKRSFNKKLRDMIEFCLDDPVQQTSRPDSISGKINKCYSKNLHSDKDIKNQNNSPSVALHLSKESNLLSEGEYNMASIEARMKRMEQLLLRKIEQNSQRILDLKDVVVSAVSEKKSVVTQTEPLNEESHKKQLFDEIRHYLCADSASLIYEEMFLSKFKRKPEKSSVTPVQLGKRRRNR